MIVYRQRHFFNPAAFGACVGGVIGLSSASWWIGSPTFIIVTTLLAFAVLYKTRRVLLGLLFVVLSATLIVLSSMANGEPLQSAISTSLMSWPIVFLAGFMLSEPLTLPPRRWQMYTVAVVVAIVTALPFHIGWFNSSPAFALLVGNGLAFVLGFRQRRGVQLRFKTRRAITPTAEEYVFETSEVVQFTAGQYIELTLPHTHPDIRGSRRMFSITSAPGTKELCLGVKFYEPSSSFKRKLRSLKPGSAVQATDVTGDFVLPRSIDRKLLFVAGGIGITPFISQIQSVAHENRNITLLYFARSPKEIAYRKLFDVSSVSVHYFVAEDTSANCELGAHLTREILQEYVPDLADREVYISGPPLMVSSAVQLVRQTARKVHTDYFSGY